MDVLKIIVIFLFIGGCTPQKRLTRLMVKHPYLFENKDTVIYRSTPEVDTTFIFSKDTLINKDTFTIVETKTYIYRHNDTIRVEQKPIRDTITVRQIITPERKQKKLLSLFEVISLFEMVTLLLILWLILWNRRKK